MKKRIFLNLLACSVGSVLILIFVYYFRLQNLNETLMGFLRKPAPVKLEAIDSLKAPGQQFYIAGAVDGKIYLGKKQVPMQLWSFGKQLRDTLPINLQSAPFSFQNMQMKIYGNQIYVLDGNQPFIRRGELGDWNIADWITGFYFLMAVPISANSSAVMSRVDDMATLGKLNSHGVQPEWFPTLLEKQVDGYFCSFGQLLTDLEQNRLVYTYLYRNQFIVTDTGMNLLYRANTIDTISRARVKTGKSDKTTFSLLTPPLTVNLQSDICNGKLYIYSNMRAENETRKTFLHNSPIDVYDLGNGQYLHSLYLPNRYGEKILAFKILDNQHIFALYQDEFVRYELTNY